LSLPAASHAPHTSSDVDTTALQAQLSDALSRITELETECKEANEVIDYAEEIVEKFKQQIREYASNHQSATIGKSAPLFEGNDHR
jgi:peptidoglycan hydrolase CwlO-like protein